MRPDGTLDPGAHSFTNRPVDAMGSFVDNHKLWTIHYVAYHNTVQAGRSTLVRYSFHLPANSVGPVTITAAVEYRHLRQTYLNNVLGKDHAAYPIVELASRSRVVNLGENPVTPPLASDNQEWMRWNNPGIGYLDQLQYDDASHAFEQVLGPRPDFKDGYVNPGLNFIEWEKYGEARRHSKRHCLCIRMMPGRSTILHFSSAGSATRKRKSQTLTKSFHSNRELGISYYEQHRIEDAIEQFKALQAIDPNDVAAHYNLDILYRRVGMKQQASVEAARYAIKQIDAGAPTYSLGYLRAHPEISNESVPWHIHAETLSGATPTAGQP